MSGKYMRWFWLAMTACWAALSGAWQFIGENGRGTAAFGVCLASFSMSKHYEGRQR